VREKPENRQFTKVRVVKGGNASIISYKLAHRLELVKIGTDIFAVGEEDLSKIKEFPSVPEREVKFDLEPGTIPTKNAYCSKPVAF
jgi:hypothetical protein